MRATLVDPLRDAGWARLVATAPGTTIFHHPRWLELLQATYRYPMAAALVTGDDGEPLAGLPIAGVRSRLHGRRLLALPFSDACPPLVARGVANADAEAALDRVATTIERERGRRDVPLEICAPFPALGRTVDRFLLHLVDLRDGYAAAEARWAARARRHVRAAERAGVRVERRVDRAALDTFYALHVQTRRRLGVPTQPKRFIRGLGALMAAGLGYVAIAIHDGRPIAAAVFLRAGSTLTYKYGASDERFLHTRPNNLLFARAMGWACDDGATTLDLGRTEPLQLGLASFKRSLGAAEEPLAYTYRGFEPRVEPGALERVAASVIRRSPPVLGRAVGELLYRHAG